VENLVGSRLRGRSWLVEGIGMIFALILVSCNAILDHALPVKHLLRRGCALVGRKISPLVAPIGGLFLPVDSVVANFLNVGAITVNEFVTGVHVIPVRF